MNSGGCFLYCQLKYLFKEKYTNYDSVFKCLVIAIDFQKYTFKVLLFQKTMNSKT